VLRNLLDQTDATQGCDNNLWRGKLFETLGLGRLRERGLRTLLKIDGFSGYRLIRWKMMFGSVRSPTTAVSTSVLLSWSRS
jgi:hypothetical protein